MILLLLAAVAPALPVNDGSFENGTCGSGSDWTCVTSQPACETIVDPVASWGYPAYDGSLAVWLGGVCDNIGISNSVCQDITISPARLTWWWMGWYSLAGEQEAWLQVTVDGQLAFEHRLGPEHNTMGVWTGSEDGFGTVDLRPWEDGLPHTLCIGMDNSYANNGGTTANLLIDMIELNHPVSTAASSFSTIKVLY